MAGDQRFQHVGHQRGRHARVCRHAFAEDQKVVQGQCAANLRTRATANHDRLDLRQIAFQVFRIRLKQSLADDKAQDRVAKKFQPLVRFQAVQCAPRRGLAPPAQHRFIAKRIADTRFARGNLFWRQFLNPHGAWTANFMQKESLMAARKLAARGKRGHGPPFLRTAGKNDVTLYSSCRLGFCQSNWLGMTRRKVGIWIRMCGISRRWQRRLQVFSSRTIAAKVPRKKTAIRKSNRAGYSDSSTGNRRTRVNIAS